MSSKFFRFTTLTLVTLFSGALCARAQAPAGGANLDSALLKAVDRGDRASVERLLDEGANIEGVHGNKETPLLMAADRGRAAIVKLLVERGANIHAQVSGETALAMVARRADSELTRILLERTPTLTEKNQALLAATRSEPAVINLDAPEGTDKFAQADEMNYESSAPYAEVVNLLLDAGANIEARDYDGNTPLMSAASYGEAMVVKVLLARGADINATDPEGGTALMGAACDCGVIDKPDTRASLKLLLDSGAKIELKTKEGKTALMFAATSDRSDLLELLLQKGANINATDRDGNTALILAAEGSVIPTAGAVKTLLEHGAVVNATNKSR